VIVLSETRSKDNTASHDIVHASTAESRRQQT